MDFTNTGSKGIKAFFSRPSVLLTIVSLLLHALANGRYGFFRDELYFIVCGDRPDWGYVDQPALIPLLASWSHTLFGDFVWGFRLVPALVMSATVGLTAEVVSVLGGRRFAQWLAGLCVLLGPIFLLQGVLFSTDLFQPLTFLGLAWALVRLEQSGEERWWLAIGAMLGFSLNTKYLIAFYVAALAIGLMVTPLRKSLLRPWIYLGALLTGLMALPNVLWQQAHGWPFIELGKAGAGGKNLEMSPLAFLSQQVLLTGPFASIVWAFGLWSGLVRPKLGVAYAFPIAWLILLLVFDSSHGKSHGKPYYLAAIYPALLAFGAARIEAWLLGPMSRGVALAGVALVGALMAPFTLPILPLDMFIPYQQASGFKLSGGERRKIGLLPQYYSDMFGWPEMAAKIAAVYRSLPPQDRARAVFYGENYGEAAAIDVFGRRLGLPPAIGGHNNYYLWGPRGHDGGVIIIIGGDPQHYAAVFRKFYIAGHIDSPYAMPDETNKPIYVLRDLKTPLQAFWPTVKHYD